MKRSAFNKITVSLGIFIGLTLFPVSAANGQSDNIGINGKVKIKKAVSKNVTDRRRCAYPLCGGVYAKARTNQRNAKRSNNNLPFDKGTLPPAVRKRRQAGILPYIEQN